MRRKLTLGANSADHEASFCFQGQIGLFTVHITAFGQQTDGSVIGAKLKFMVIRGTEIFLGSMKELSYLLVSYKKFSLEDCSSFYIMRCQLIFSGQVTNI